MCLFYIFQSDTWTNSVLAKLTIFFNLNENGYRIYYLANSILFENALCICNMTN